MTCHNYYDHLGIYSSYSREACARGRVENKGGREGGREGGWEGKKEEV